MRWFLVDRILELEPGKTATGVKCFSRSEQFFEQHFQGMPIVPGVLQIEMMAQMGGKCIRSAKPDVLTVIGQVKNAKFYRNIEPGDQAIIKVQVEKIASSYAIATAIVEVGGVKVSQAEIMYGMIKFENMKSGLEDEVLIDYFKRKEAKERSAQLEGNA